MRFFLAILLLPSAASAQWLPDSVQSSERAIWETTGVEFPEGSKFFSLPRVSQRLVVIDGQDRFGVYDDTLGGSNNVNRVMPWDTPAGLGSSPKDQWRTAKAAFFPGTIRVRTQNISVPNSPVGRTQASIAWTFPDGTIFSEMLVRKYRGLEWPFEIRQRRKVDGRWDDGITFRPWANAENLPSGSVRREFTVFANGLRAFGLGNADLTAYKLPPRSLLMPTWDRLTSSRLTVTATDDHSALPREFFGTTRRCAHCHEHAGKPVNYGVAALRGSDTIFSWAPYIIDGTLNSDATPRLDGRWGLEIVNDK